MSNLEIYHDGQDIRTVQPLNDHMLPPEKIIPQNADFYDDDEYIESAGDDSSEYALEDGYSKSGYD